MKKLFALLLLCLSMQAYALEIEGVKLADTVQVGNATLQLNGAGVRSMFFFDIYVAALYLDGKKSTSEAVMAGSGPVRIELHVLRDVGSERFVHGFRKGIEKNSDAAQLARLTERMAAFEKLFASMDEARKGDVMAFDWQPGAATRVSVNGTELGRIEGDDFFHALLSIWIGDKPVMESLKKELLGG